MRRFDEMVSGFKNAINRAKTELHAQGFEEVDRISSMIMEKGGIKKEIS